MVRLFGQLAGLGCGPGEISQETSSVHVAANGLVDHSQGDSFGFTSDSVIECAEELGAAFSGLELGLVCRHWLLVVGFDPLPTHAIDWWLGRFVVVAVFSG